MAQDCWTVARTDYSEQAIESANTIFTVCNGYLALKGNLLENRTGRHPSTFVAAVFGHADYFAFVRPVSYERRHFDPKYFDDAGPNPSIANLPNPLMLRVFLDNRELSFRRGAVSEFRQEYDLRRGVYTYSYVFEDTAGRRTQIASHRFCDMRHPHRAHLRYVLTPLNYSGCIRFESGIDGTIRSNLREDLQYEVVTAEVAGARCSLTARTFLKGQHVYLHCNHAVAEAQTGPGVVRDGECYAVFEWSALAGQPLVMEKQIVVASDEDARHGAECDPQAELAAASAEGYSAAYEKNAQWWAHAWDRFDVCIEGDNLAQTYLRFCIMHLISAAPRHTDRLSIPCKLLTGEWYQGTVFYDTDLYIEPMFLFGWPDVAKAMLEYRYVCLDPGRRIAERFGWQGAKLAWQAGPYGEEELGYWWRYTLTNIHINGDVAYSAMQYWYATQDLEFLAARIAEMLVEFARFYVSRATWDEGSDTYHFEGVAGPDEGHCESTDNFYTNLLARKTLEWAVQVLEILERERPADHARLVDRFRIGHEEIELWKRVAGRIALLLDPQTGLIEQYKGYYDLLPIPENLLANRKEWWTPVFPYQAIHQPDVTMALAMFRDEYDERVLQTNYEYYKERCMNFSSMSFPINAIMAKVVGDMEYAYEQFLVCAGEDLDETMTKRYDVKDGIHGTASGGAWLAAVSGFGGIFLSARGLSVDPRLPAHWRSLSFRLRYLGQDFEFFVTQSALRIMAGKSAAEPIELLVRGERVLFEPGSIKEFALER